MADLFDKEELSVVGSLFGSSPEGLALAREQQYLNFAKNVANAEAVRPGTGTVLGANVMGARGVEQLGGMFGIESPEVKLSKLRQQAQQQFDPTTPQGLAQIAQFLNQNGDAAGARQAVMLAQGQMQKTATLSKTEAETTRALREPGKTAMTQLIASGKYTPASVGKFQETQNPADLVLAKGAAGEGGVGGIGVAGPVGKAGAWRDADGTVYSAAEMAKQRAGFQGLEKLAENLNMITPADIKQSESWVDWTAGESRKQFGGKIDPKTVAAQAKINAAQLLKQIESLPPGSASNADMIAAKSSFPGYGNAKALEDWIGDTKTKLANSLQRQSDQYGFKPRVTVTGLSSSPAGVAITADDPLGLRTKK